MRTHNPKKKSRGIYFAALFLVVIVGCVALVYSIANWTAAAKAKKLQNPFPQTDAAWGAGMSVYLDNCQKCHGENGDGKGEKASELSVAPGNLTDKKKMDELTDGELYWQVTKGKKPMPGFEDKLNAEQRWNAVDYIRSLSQPPAHAAAPK